MEIDAISLVSDNERPDNGDDDDALPLQQPKKRKSNRPRPPKLEIEHLQNPLGIPTLHDKFLESFRASMKGPGHEIADLDTIISMYEEWQKRVYKYCQLDEFLRKAQKVSGMQDVLKNMRDVLSRGPRDEVMNPPTATPEEDTPLAMEEEFPSNVMDLTDDDDELVAMQMEAMMFDDLGHGACDDLPVDKSSDDIHGATPATSNQEEGTSERGQAENVAQASTKNEFSFSSPQRAVNDSVPPKKRLPEVLALTDEDLKFLDDIVE
ncbi:hypothetical protein BSKO_03453 [Bryopsis sp. KO-2023]|nr:hypothetical protein BSKO_03453 [Bryopsis sp. KO-2023]